jgi:hypothetical protein
VDSSATIFASLKVSELAGHCTQAVVVRDSQTDDKIAPVNDSVASQSCAK